MISSPSSVLRPRVLVSRLSVRHSGASGLPMPKAGNRRPSDSTSIVAHCLASNTVSRNASDSTLTPNLSRRVRPASAAIALMHSRIGSRLTMRSVCHSESMPPASHRSTQRQNPATPANGNSIKPSPIATFLGILPSSLDLAQVSALGLRSLASGRQVVARSAASGAERGRAPMRVFATLPQDDLREVRAAALAVEAEGYDGVVAMENKHDPFLALAVAGTATRRIELHTGVAIAFARTPMGVANVGWDLAGATGGRFVVGLGSQVRAHNERRFSVPWTPPAPRMREYVQSLRAIWRGWKTGERLGYEGQHYRFTLMTPAFTPEPIAAPPPAVMIAAVGPAMLKVAAEECDGVKLHGFCTRKYLEEAVMPRLAEGLAKSGSRRENYEISGGGFLATGPDDAMVARMFEWVRERVAFYGSTQAYWPVLAPHGLEELGHKLNAMTRQGKWNEMAKEVPDDVVHLFAAVGRYDQIVKAIG